MLIEANRILLAIRDRRQPYRYTDIAMASQLPKGVVRQRLTYLLEAGRIEEYWDGDLGPFYRIPEYKS